ncbi:MAG: hypothetical protein LBS93_01205, partial [Synergistaceae bacterium]|nr:hypothetical protein [Synergistaceae bacterium]
MPILLEEDMRYQLPRMHKVKQTFPKPRLDDLEGRIAEELGRAEIRVKIKPGAKVAVAVGSRGIKNISTIVKAVLDQIKQAGASPFIVTAMGSHGGGNPDGQKEVLRSYDIIEEKMGVDVVSSVDVTLLGKT